MANVNNIRIGDSTPDAILFNSPDITNKPSFLTYALCTIDNNNEYRARGLWLAPISPWGFYSWPWNLNITGGACKDISNGALRWGYVQDGSNKNITSDMTKNFAENVKGNYHVAISIWTEYFNYTDDAGRQCTDFGDVPIVITFKDGRFDDYNWVLEAGAVAEWSEDKRTCTIYRVPSSHKVFQSNNTDKTIAKVREDLYNVIVDVTGLDYNFNSYVEADASSVECWDVMQGETTLYHKDKTFDNCWKKYKYVGEETSYDEGVYYDDDYINIKSYATPIANYNTEYTSFIIPDITDLNEHIYKFDADKKECHFLTFNTKPKNKEFWNPIKEWFSNNTLYNKPKNLFKNSNLDEITINIDVPGNNVPDEPFYIFLSDFFEETQLKKISLNLERYQIGSGNNLFKGAKHLKEFSINSFRGGYIRAYDYAGMFEFCGSLESLPNNIFAWNERVDTSNMGVDGTNMGYTFEYCGALKSIPINIQANGDRFSNSNTCIPSFMNQTFNGCHKLTYIGPVLDVKLIYPDTLKMPFYCGSLEDVRIKNLNHGDWHFDDTPNAQNYYHGNIPLLNKESIDYLFEKLTDLTTYDATNQIDDDAHNFMRWHSVNKNSVYIKSRDALVLLKNFNGQIVTTDKALNNVEVTVSGLNAGDKLTFGTLEITENGNYVLNNTEGTTTGFAITNGPTSTSGEMVNIVLKTYFKREAPKVDHANLYVPNKWLDKITADMITAANNKGWKIYSGGVEITPSSNNSVE